MGWKVAVAVVATTLSVPVPAAAEMPECSTAPTDFDAWADGDVLHLIWGLPADCPGTDGYFELYRNGILVNETSEVTYSEPLALPAAYTLTWVSGETGNNSDPSTLVLFDELPRAGPQIHLQGLEAFVDYLIVIAPCPPIVMTSHADIPWLFEIAWNCLPISNTRVGFV